ncbi:MAG: urease accessory protein UreE [Aestuariivita sp.]|nr:urease accessory protein UreE [Aestuariivita sp.]MCY4202884.1 urease accessory protein UreE [Aestuariivita sp.]MCY4346802.1 urease accessory protein UreE [Aestuariivita sp.]
MTTVKGHKFLVNFVKTIAVNQHDAFVLEDGHRIGVVLALEPLLEVKGNLSRLAWHIGNRHTPCQIEQHRLLIQDNHVMADMLRVLGAKTRSVTEPFDPERGAYGLGRTHAHTH